jgi:hypothetical protein
VGREAELRQLQGCLAQAQGGARQVVFVTGEPGIGKTTVVDVFLAGLAPDPTLWVAWGQCLEHYGVGEAYLPVLAALAQLCRAPGGERLIAVLGQYAPTWLVQRPVFSAHRGPVHVRETGRQTPPGALSPAGEGDRSGR